MLNVQRRAVMSRSALDHTREQVQGHAGPTKGWFAKLPRSRNLLVKLLAATLMGVTLPAIMATPAVAASCDTSIANPGRPAGSPPLPPGSYVCEYGVTVLVYDSRWHAFLVGTNSSNSIYHTWQGSGGGSYGPWVSLGGTGRSSVIPHLYNNPSGGKAIEIAVVGLSNVRYCKNYNGSVGGGWWPSQTAWTSNPASCHLF